MPTVCVHLDVLVDGFDDTNCWTSFAGLRPGLIDQSRAWCFGTPFPFYSATVNERDSTPNLSHFPPTLCKKKQKREREL